MSSALDSTPAALASTPTQGTLLVPGEVAIELHQALLTGRRSRLEVLLERLPLTVLTFLNRDIVGRIARVTARRKLLQTLGVQGQAPPELTITDAACRMLAIRLLTEYRDASARRGANPAASERERWEASARAQLLSDYLCETDRIHLASPKQATSATR